MNIFEEIFERIQQFIFGNDCPVNAVRTRLTRATGRKRRDTHRFTAEQLDDIRYIWKARDSFNIKTFIDLKNHVNDKYTVNKSRSVYCKVINKKATYAEK
jgi:hypothetical protein